MTFYQKNCVDTVYINMCFNLHKTSYSNDWVNTIKKYNVHYAFCIDLDLCTLPYLTQALFNTICGEFLTTYIKRLIVNLELIKANNIFPIMRLVCFRLTHITLCLHITNYKALNLKSRWLVGLAFSSPKTTNLLLYSATIVIIVSYCR